MSEKTCTICCKPIPNGEGHHTLPDQHVACETSQSAKIEFKRVLRECGHNAALQKTGKDSLGRKGKLLYDFEVRINGELRAIWYGCSFQRGYDLLIPSKILHTHITTPSSIPGRRPNTIKAPSQKEFEPLVKQYLAVIPTVQDIAKMEREKAEEERSRAEKEERSRAEKIRISNAIENQNERYVKHGEQMLDMIERLRLAIDQLQPVSSDENEALHEHAIQLQKQARQLIATVKDTKP